MWILPFLVFASIVAWIASIWSLFKPRTYFVKYDLFRNNKLCGKGDYLTTLYFWQRALPSIKQGLAKQELSQAISEAKLADGETMSITVTSIVKL